MKNKTIAILLLATTIFISGCGGCSKNEASTEPTEVVMETETEEPTETEEIALETESIIETETEEPIDIYSDEVIGTLAMYDFFEGSTDEEIRQFIKDNEDTQEVLNTHDAEFIDFWMTGLKDLCAGTLYEINHPATTNNSSTSGNKSNSNSNSNSASTSNKTQSNSNASTPSQDTDTTKGYGDAGGNNTSEAPVQSVDDGFEDESNLDLSQFETDLGEWTGDTGLIQ